MNTQAKAPAKAATPAKPVALAKPAVPKAEPKAPPTAPVAQAVVKTAAKKAEASKVKAAPAKADVKEKKAHKKEKSRKIKVVRDSFTMPEGDYAKIAELKKKCLEAGVFVKKSELLRAGVLSLSKLSAAALVKAVEQVEVVKTGRPAKG